MRNLDTVVAFYETTNLSTVFDQQNRFREYVDKDTPLICFTDTMLPFVIRRRHTVGTTSSLTWWLSYYETSTSIQMSNSLLAIQTIGLYDYIIFSAEAAASITAGKFFILVQDNFPGTPVLYYSETFEAKPAAARPWFTEILFCNRTKINMIPALFYQKVFIDNIFKCPDFLRKDVGDEVDGLIVYEKQIVQPIMILRDMVTPEYLVHALVYLTINDYVKVTEGDGSVWFPQVTKIKDPEWTELDKGATAKVEIQFTVKTIIKKLTFSENDIEGGTVTMGRHFEPKTMVIPADMEVDFVWDIPFASNTYTYVLTAFDLTGNPVFPSPVDQTTEKLTLHSQLYCVCRVVAGE